MLANEDTNNEIATLERSLRDVEETITKIKNQQITQDGVYNFILEFGQVYKELPEMKKKTLVNTFIDKVEIFPEEQEDGSIIKSITFKFPLGGFGDNMNSGVKNSLTTGNHVETVVLLSKIN